MCRWDSGPKQEKAAMAKAPLFTLLTGLLALSACSNQAASPTPAPQSPSVSRPAETKKAAIFELQMRRTSEGQAANSWQPLALRGADNSLAFSYVSANTTQIAGQWYVRITYQVTNTGSAPLHNLSFVPVDTDLDPATATSSTPTPTVGSSYFKNIMTFGGTDASERAADLNAEQGRDVNGNPDPSATPYVAIDTSSVQPNLPTGLVLGTGGKSPNGWQTSGDLAPNASVNVTFATRMNRVSPQADPFQYSVVLMSMYDAAIPVGIVPTTGANPHVDLPTASPAYVNGTLGDPTDPAATEGLKFTVAASDADAAGLSVNATSSDNTVATAALSGTGATRTLKITPLKVGKADLTVTVADGGRNVSYVVHYAASQAQNPTANTHFLSGISNASSAQDAGGGYMLVADDEFNFLSLYPRNTSSVPVAKFDFTSQLALPDAANPEVDFEAGARSGNRIYWMGSHSNSKNGKLRPNRYRIMATDISGSGASTNLSYVGRFDHLRDNLLAWDQGNGNALGLTASAAAGLAPEDPSNAGFNLEGLAFAPGSTTAYLGFRAPTVPTTNRTKALIVPVTNFPDLVTGAATTATFGSPIQLDLGGRGIRELKCNDTSCLILAGPASGGSNFALYSWTGNPTDAPHLRNDLSALATSMDGSLESIVSVPAGNLDSDALTGQTLQLLTDNGDSIYYGDGLIAKDLVSPAQNWQKFRSEIMTVGAMPAATCTVNSVTVTPANPTLTVGAASTAFRASAVTTPANCATTTTWSSSDPSKLSIDPNTGVAQAVAAGNATISATVTPAGGSAATGQSNATVVGAVTSLPNVTVYRVGSGASALSSAGTAVFLDTFSGTDGSLVTSVALPTSAAGNNKPLVASGSAGSEGLLTRSADGRFLVLTGYGAAPGTAAIASSASASVPRVVGRVDAAGTIDTSTALNIITGNNIRSAASSDGNSFYVAGASGGVQYANLGATTTTALNTALANVRQVNIFDGQLYGSSGSGTNTFKGVSSVGTGLPTTSSQSATRLPGLTDTVSSDSYSFFMADLDGLPGLDTLYIADSTSGLQKFTLSGGNWIKTSTLASTVGALTGLTGTVINGQVTLFTTSNTTLAKITDASGYGGPLAGALTTLQTAATNTVFRGVALTPTP